MKILFALTLTLFSFSCATNTSYVSVRETRDKLEVNDFKRNLNQKEIRISLKNYKDWVPFGNDVEFYIDEVMVAKLGNGGVKIINIKKGKYIICTHRTRAEKPFPYFYNGTHCYPVDINQSGQKFEIGCNINNSAMGGIAHLCQNGNILRVTSITSLQKEKNKIKKVIKTLRPKNTDVKVMGIREAKAECKGLGFKIGTELFGKCVLELIE